MNGKTDFLLREKDLFFKKVWRSFHYYRLSPKITNRYQRHSFVDEFINFKVSFDADFSALSLYQKNMLPLNPVRNNVIMEIKFGRYIPDYFSQIIKKYDLERIPSSKYLLSLQNSYPKYSAIIKN